MRPDLTGYPGKPESRIYGRISGAGRIQDIRPDFQLSIKMSHKIWKKNKSQT
jgi:hypothetical protein